MAENYVSYSNANALATKIGNKLRSLNSAYQFKGSITFASLPASLTSSMDGYVYNISDDFTTDNRFIDGSGKKYSAGTNVAVANIGTPQSPNMMFDVIGNFIDITVDSALSTTSVNPVQNKVITGEINGIEEKIPSGASSSNKMATASDVTDVYDVMGKNGAKNLLPFVYSVRNRPNGYSGGSYRIDNEGYIVSANTNDNRLWEYDACNFWIKLSTGSYKLRIEADTQATSLAGIAIILADETKLYSKEVPSQINDELNKDITITLSTDETVGIMYKVGDGKYRFSLRHAEDTDISWTPFAMTNKAITNDFFGASANDILGAKNLFDISKFVPFTYHGVTVSSNGEDFVVDGEMDSEGSDYYPAVAVFTEKTLPKGKYKLCIYKDSNFNFAFWVRASGQDIGNGVGTGLTDLSNYDEQEFEVTYNGYTEISLLARIIKNAVYDNNTARVMIKSAYDESKEYMPYSMTNKQLTDNKANLDSNGKVLSSELPVASTSTLGAIKPDGTTITVDANGVASANGGGGTTVVPNPTGTATGDLTKVQIGNDIYSIHDTTYSDATTSASGLMSSSDKTKLNGIANNANNYSLPTAASGTKGGVKVGDGLAISNEILSNPSMVYSTTEKVVGKWTDGKPIYQKTFTGNAPSVTTDGTEENSGDIPIGATVATVIEGQCILSLTSGANHPLPLIVPNPTNNKVGRFCIYDNRAANKNTFRVYSNTTSWNTATYRLTIRYTKTTD